MKRHGILSEFSDLYVGFMAGGLLRGYYDDLGCGLFSD